MLQAEAGPQTALSMPVKQPQYCVTQNAQLQWKMGTSTDLSCSLMLQLSIIDPAWLILGKLGEISDNAFSCWEISSELRENKV